MSGGGRPGALVAVKMEAAPFYGHEGLELLPDFAQLPGGFGSGPGAAGGLAEPAEGSAVDPQQQHKLLLAGKKPLLPPRGDLLVGSSASAGHAALAPAGPSFPSLRPRGAVHRLLPETGGGGAPEVGPGVLQPLLKLPAAADLEQLLLQAGSPGLPGGPASPTGGGGGAVAGVPGVVVGGGGPFLYRSPPPPPPPAQPVTQEQEGFADGFVKALADLHKQNQLLGGPPPPPPPSAGPPPPLSPAPHPGGGGPCCPPPSRQDSPAVYTTLGGFDPGSPSSGGSGAFFSAPAGPRLPGSAGRALEEPQRVPESPGVVPGLAPGGLSSGESPPPSSSASASAAALSPLDAESQERLKAERKRLRNRIAASKCRRRKLERIARLEEKVKALKGQNAELATTASLLRAQVSQLQGRVRSHLSSGCHINATATAPGPSSQLPLEPRETSAC